MDAIYRLCHVYMDQYGEINEKSIGLFRTRETADRAQAHYVTLPGFCDYPDDFLIEPVTLDESAWAEGFFQDGCRDANTIAQAAARAAARAVPPLRYHMRDSPDGYWIYELRRGETSLGCEVGRVGGPTLAEGVTEAVAHRLALEHAGNRLDESAHAVRAKSPPSPWKGHDAERVVVHDVWHEHESSGGGDEMRYIGVYRTQEAAEAARSRAATLPGFRDYPDELYSGESILDESCGWSDGFVTFVND